jgi:hypothetical protein
MGNDKKSWKGAPTTNLITGALSGMQGVSLSFLGLENGWKKYAMSGTFTAGTYPYIMNMTSTSFTGGVTYSSSCFIKTNVEYKFNYFATAMNYVNQPMTKAGTSFSIAQPDGSFYIGRSNFAYTSTTTQVGFISTNPINNTTFDPATDFVWFKDGQVELGEFPTPFAGDSATRSNTEAIIDWTGNATITASSPTYNSDGSFTFNGGTERLDISNSIPISNNFSWSAWIRSNDISQTQNIVSMNGPYFMRISNSRVRFNILTSDGWLFQNGTTTLSSDTWYNLCMVWNGATNTWTGYINGDQEFSVSKSGTVTYSSLYGYVGYTPQGGEQSYFNGNIPVLYCHAKALSAAEVTQNFNALRGRYGI